MPSHLAYTQPSTQQLCTVHLRSSNVSASCAEARLGAEQYLREWGGELFPPWLEGTIHPVMTAVLPLDVDSRLVHLQAVFPDLLTSLGACSF